MTPMTDGTDPWPNHKVLELWTAIREALDVPFDMDFGAALWTVFSNNERVIDEDGCVVDTGAWRYAGGMIATLCGGDYMDYYCSYLRADEGLVERIRAALRLHGFTFTDWDEWERGVLEDRYRCPPQWKEFFEGVRRGEHHRVGDVL